MYGAGRAGGEIGVLRLNADLEVLPDPAAPDGAGDSDGAAQTTGGVKLPPRHPGVKAGATTDDCPSAETDLLGGLSVQSDGPDPGCADLIQQQRWNQALQCSQDDPKSTTGTIAEISAALELQGAALVGAGRPAEAVKQFEEAAKLREFEGGDTEMPICMTLEAIARANEAARNWGASRRSWQLVVSDPRCAGCHDTATITAAAWVGGSSHPVAHARARLATLAHVLGDVDTAVAEWQHAIEQWETAAAPCRASDAAVMVMRATRSLCLSLLDNDAGKADLHRRYAAMQATATAALAVGKRDDKAENAGGDAVPIGAGDGEPMWWADVLAISEMGQIAVQGAGAGVCATPPMPMTMSALALAEWRLLRGLYLAGCNVDSEGTGVDDFDEAIALVEQVLGTAMTNVHPVAVSAKRATARLEV